MSVFKNILVGFPIFIASYLISDSWLSGWVSCVIYWIAAYLTDKKEKKYEP